MKKRVFQLVFITLISAVFFVSCAAPPETRPEPELKPPPPPPPSAGFVMKSYHESMKTGMQISYDQADEILIGIYTGLHEDPELGNIHYLDDFLSFDKTTLTWGPNMKVVVQIQEHKKKPVIIKKKEFPRLVPLDKIGICWDEYEGSRDFYLVEGQKMLVFLETGFDEASNRAFRLLIDSYPVTTQCNAKAVFDLMIQDHQ